jgi:hypothetical protein
MLTLLERELQKLGNPFKSYEIGQGTTVMKVNVTKTGRTWKSDFDVICPWI